MHHEHADRTGGGLLRAARAEGGALWLEQNQDADRFFLTVESFDPHEPWLLPAHYRRMYLEETATNR